jgi:trehalose/maltose hydrolase-like predicted phosphorylase
MIIGIDPDTEKNGVAIVSDNKVKLINLPFWELIELIRQKHSEDKNLVVVIEKGEINKAIFSANHSKTKAIAAKIGTAVGKNFQISSILEDYCKKYDINYKKYVPTTKKWDKQYMKDVFEITKRTNQEQRDALRCALAFHKKTKP